MGLETISLVNISGSEKKNLLGILELDDSESPSFKDRRRIIAYMPVVKYSDLP